MKIDRRNSFRALALAASCALAGLLLCGCSSESDPQEAAAGSGEPATEDTRPARTLPIPGGSDSLPPGHPPTGGGGELAWDVPAEWSEVPPSSSMRYAQYAVDGPGGPGECVVFYFGPNQGGDPAANAERWAGQFSQPDGASSMERMTFEAYEGADVPVYLVEVTGTFEGGMTGSTEPFEPRPDYMLLGAIAEGPDAPWFFKFTGPESTVRAQREAFISMMESIRSGA